MEKTDLNALTEYWHRETNYLNEKVDDAFKAAQDHAYALGLARGRAEAAARLATAPTITNERIMELAEPFGAFEFGDAQGHKRVAFGRAVIAEVVGVQP